MHGPHPPAVLLSDHPRAVVERLSRCHTSPQRLVRRLRIVLAAASGHNNDQIARRLDIHRSTAQLWRMRWLMGAARRATAVTAGDDDRLLALLVADALDDAPRTGAPPTFTAEHVVQIVALACESPPGGGGGPVSHWTPRELAAEAVTRAIVPSISPRSVGRFLKGGPSPTASEPLLADSWTG